MDTSLMCEKAVEIQKGWKPENGDCYIYKPTGNQGMVCLDNPLFEGDTEYYIWLPRQDQLQEMIFEFFDVVEKIQSIYQFIFTTHKKIGPNNVWMTDDYIMAFTSMEQLWLAFVMKEKYQKIWDDKKKGWIKCQVAQ